jgi:hypothetical protein
LCKDIEREYLIGKNGVDIEVIIRSTGLTKEEINKLLESF